MKKKNKPMKNWANALVYQYSFAGISLILIWVGVANLFQRFETNLFSFLNCGKTVKAEFETLSRFIKITWTHFLKISSFQTPWGLKLLAINYDLLTEILEFYRIFIFLPNLSY